MQNKNNDSSDSNIIYHYYILYTFKRFNFLDIPITLSHEKYREYCSKLFKFKKIKFMRFR